MILVFSMLCRESRLAGGRPGLVSRLASRVEIPGARQEAATRPSLNWLTHTGTQYIHIVLPTQVERSLFTTVSRPGSQPGMVSRAALYSNRSSSTITCTPVYC